MPSAHDRGLIFTVYWAMTCGPCLLLGTGKSLPFHLEPSLSHVLCSSLYWCSARVLYWRGPPFIVYPILGLALAPLGELLWLQAQSDSWLGCIVAIAVHCTCRLREDKSNGFQQGHPSTNGQAIWSVTRLCVSTHDTSCSTAVNMAFTSEANRLCFTELTEFS